MPSHKNVAVIAAAGSGKTETVIDTALARDGRVLILTFTNENRHQIEERIVNKLGAIPENVEVRGWFEFLINECCRPYQTSLTNKVGFIGSLNFQGQRPLKVARSDSAYYFDRHRDMYRDGVADFAMSVQEASDGAVIDRLQRIYSTVLVDEVQDLVGYDLEVLELLLRSSIDVVLVGDLRQHTYSTNENRKNQKYRGAGFLHWLEERTDLCALEFRDVSHRCNQAICDFADELFPEFPPTKSLNAVETGHDGVFAISANEVSDYASEFAPTVLRYNKRADTLGLRGMNIGVSKGRTFDRVLLFPTKPMMSYYKTRDLEGFKTRELLYVAVTRARYSVTFVR